jgi:hypothetical protein
LGPVLPAGLATGNGTTAGRLWSTLPAVPVSHWDHVIKEDDISGEGKMQGLVGKCEGKSTLGIHGLRRE